MGPCPFCAEAIHKGAIVYEHCGQDSWVQRACYGVTARHARASRQAIQMRVELKAVFEAAKETSALPRSIGLSIGCAEVEPDTTDIAAVIRDADQRMYEDKRAARE